MIPLLFDAVTPFFAASFWAAVSREQLHKWQLDDSAKVLYPFIQIHRRSLLPSTSVSFTDVAIATDAAAAVEASPPYSLLVPATLVNFLSLEQFNNSLLPSPQELPRQIAPVVESLKALLSFPSRLFKLPSFSSLTVFTYLDLKSQRHLFRVCWPSLYPEAPGHKDLALSSIPLGTVTTVFGCEGAAGAAFGKALDKVSCASAQRGRPLAFAVVRRGGAWTAIQPAQWEAAETATLEEVVSALAVGDAAICVPQASNRCVEQVKGVNRHVVGSSATRNTIVSACCGQLFSLVSARRAAEAPACACTAGSGCIRCFGLPFVLLQEAQETRDMSDSVVVCIAVTSQGLVVSPHAQSNLSCRVLPGWVRFEGPLAALHSDSRDVTVGESSPAGLSATTVAAAAASLNLELMKWRALPSLPLECLARTRCLLVGSGTLGCNVARNLMMWGMQRITFIDGGTVSASNPVRQSLFEFADTGILESARSGKNKAVAAAEALIRIHPPAIDTVRGVELAIPMPGHAIAERAVADFRRDVRVLRDLVAEHDVIFLLTDSREGRWLAGALGHAASKIVISVALGFDSWVASRHGYGQQSPAEVSASIAQGLQTPASELGCYFCTEMQPPTDSMRDRTIDLACTVTRPGVSAVASATAVELLVNLLSHPAGPSAPAAIPSTRGGGGAARTPETPVGPVPHQVRGTASTFESSVITGARYSRCCCCSSRVSEAVQDDDFILSVCNGSNALDCITGADAFKTDSGGPAVDGSGGDAFDDDFAVDDDF